MCGIAGIISTSKNNQMEWVVRAMADAVRHRGPDDEGFYTAPGVALGMRRLSIIDLAGGKQPIHNEDGTVWTVFNGEIYNFHELREDLERRGHRFSTSSDTEVIVHVYEEHGDDCPKHLRGMFAFAVYDLPNHKLLLARDRVGKKPLVYARSRGGLSFASEFQGLLADPAVPREVNREAVHRYLTFGYVPAPMSAYRGVSKVLPGHVLTWQDGLVAYHPYWQLTYSPKLQL